MVLFHSTSLDQRRNCGLLMSAEDTGLGAFASPLVGYLGKVNERASSLEYCPWCTSKGLTHTLRSYRVNLKESITLCTNSDCLFPLVSQSLDDILASLVPVKPPVDQKRKLPSALQDEDPVNSKRHKSTDPENILISSITRTIEESDTSRTESNGHILPNGTEGGHEVQNYIKSPQTSGDNLLKDPNALVTSSDVVGPSELLAGIHQSPRKKLLFSSAGDDVTPLSDVPCVLENLKKDDDHHVSQATSHISSNGLRSSPLPEHECKREEPTIVTSQCDGLNVEKDTEDLSRLEGLVSVGPLFWKNRDNLCWLDVLLVVFVNCKNFNNLKAANIQESLVWRLKMEYASICAAVGVHQHTENGSVKVPRHVLRKANTDLHNLRMSIFKMLQPQLQCELGQRETPVFALPLLLKMDSNIEPLFQATFSWEFKCSGCKLHTRDRVTKTLPTLTNLFPDWHPLHASNSAPCNRCSLSDQRRMMVLESVPSVFALHFVEGLPRSDVSAYDFTFKGKHYSITSIIQYKRDLRHFITWICQSDGSWLEFDDLKNKSQSHNLLPVPAQEMHMVFWEEDESKDPQICSPTITSASSPAAVDESCGLDQSLLRAHSNFDIADVLSTSSVDTTDKAIGSTTLLDAFEGLSQDDIITLTLDVIPCSNTSDPSGDLDETLVSAEVSASEVSQGGETPTNSNTTPDMFIPRMGPSAGTRSRRKNQSGNALVEHRVESSAAAPEPRVSQKPPVKVVRQPPSPVSSTQTSPPTALPSSNLVSERWSFLLSKHPAKIASKAPESPATSHQVSSRPPSHSTPLPLRLSQTVTPVLQKPKLRTEDVDTLPIKASERYSGFGRQSMVTPNPLDNTQALLSTTIPKMSSVNQGLVGTDALRYKLLKKLKAKKKKLAKLNQMLGQSGASLQPDSTNLLSPNTVTSSTYESSNCDEVLSQLLSPATTVHNLSPDSSGFLDMYVSGQEVGAGALPGGSEPQEKNSAVGVPQTENFLEEFLCQAVAEQPSVMENDVLSELDLFF